MTDEKINPVAAELRRKFFALVGEFRSLQQRVWVKDRFDCAADIDSVAARLAGEYEALPDLFIDAFRDEKDQAYNFTL